MVAKKKNNRDKGELLQSVTRTLNLLETFTRNGPELSVAQLDALMDVPKGTLYRMLHTLEAKRFLVRNAQTGNYRPGIKLWEIGCKALESIGLRQVAPSIMEELVSRCRETALLAVLDETEVVYVDVVDAPQSVRFHAWLGQRAPAHASGTGKILLAYGPREAVEKVVAKGLARYTAATITDPEIFNEELAKIRQQGYAFGGGDWIEEVVGVAAPVRKSGGQVIAALGVAGPATRFSAAYLQSLVPLVISAADELSQALGYEGGSIT